MSLAQGDNPEAAGPSGEQRGRGRGGGRSKGSRNVQYPSSHELDDDERLIRLSSTIAAAEAVCSLCVEFSGRPVVCCSSNINST